MRILVCRSFEEEELVAQLVEHITFNDGVLGSSPSQFTKPLLRQRLFLCPLLTYYIRLS
jgi:hypothetical protein